MTPEPPGRTLARLGLTPGDYVVFLGRLVPEKQPDLLVRAFAGIPGDTRLVVVGARPTPTPSPARCWLGDVILGSSFPAISSGAISRN